ncbi:hypothetical protein JCM4814A_47310 [Streptomyces phaeofaciens JCM 4814]|uniref:non-specific serine/threonine protein kinase n=1 Tax=Streptomyces phaeofaciens TaxID=68254 RepID=A0A918H2D9_9ACTN|nr:hypothetical protein GCM10010226_03970 [Streptomyces phaeofaciens]
MVDGRFELLERLGGGGMGWVWRARDLALHRDVAVKEVRPPDPALAEYDPEGARTLRERVLREARALARVHHPNVVTIHHIVDGGEGTFPWIVMELVTGGSLQDRLQRGAMTPAEAAGLGREVLSALRAAHAAGIEHRDVKPANVLLRPDGRPVLTDFGIAAIREATSLTATGSVIGSPDFMAPERVSGKEGGPAADLWSLAMLLYVAVEGHHPLRRATTLATLAAVLGEDVPPPRRAGALTPVLTAVLVRDPLARPDAAEVDRMLAAAGTAVPAQDAPRPPAAPEIPSVTSYPLAPPGYATPGPAPAPSLGAPTVHPATGAPTVHPAAAPPRSRRVRTVALAAAGAALAGVLVWTQLDSGGEGEDGDARGAVPTVSAAGSSRSASPDAGSGGTARETTDLLTGDGVRTAVAKLTEAMGGSKVTGLVVYPEYAVADRPVDGRAKLYDRYLYRGGEVAVKDGPGGTVMTGAVPVDLDVYDWDAVPALLSKAGRTLGVEKPTSRYLVVNPASTIFDTPPTLSVYLSDDYGSAYLRADVHGKVIETHPRDDG